MIFNLKYCLMHLVHLLYNRYDKQLLTLYKCNEIKFHYVSQNDLYFLINKDLKYFIFRYTSILFTISSNPYLTFLTINQKQVVFMNQRRSSYNKKHLTQNDSKCSNVEPLRVQRLLNLK